MNRQTPCGELLAPRRAAARILRCQADIEIVSSTNMRLLDKAQNPSSPYDRYSGPCEDVKSSDGSCGQQCLHRRPTRTCRPEFLLALDGFVAMKESREYA